MSTRNLKKLQKLNQTLLSNELICDSEEEIPIADDHTNSRKVAINRFELLNEYDHTDSATDNSHSENEHVVNIKDNKSSVKDANSLPKNDNSKKKNRKKNKKSKKQQGQEKNNDTPNDEDIEATIKEVCDLYDNPSTSSEPIPTPEATSTILKMELYHLNCNNEMKRRFGAKVVRDDDLSRGKVSNIRTKTSIVPNTSKMAQLGETGITMGLLDTRDGVHYFTFEHNKEYQLVQNIFLTSVDRSGDVLSLLDLHPITLDILIQSSEVLRLSEQSKLAAEHIEMALAICERSFHPKFSLTRGNCRLDYRRPENRSFFIALFKHQYYVGKQGCYRTALELCKLILSLDPEGDPLAVILLLDYYALLSKQLEYLVQFYRELNSSRNLHLLPNFSFSIPLALFKLGTENSIEKYIDESSQMLQDAILMFPSMILPLLDKCSIKPDSRIEKHPFFRASEKKEPLCLTYLIDLYISRCYSVWRDPALMAWLEECVHRALDQVEASGQKSCKSEVRGRFVGFSPNILRHLILANVRESIPTELYQGPIYSFDPLPPSDSIKTYQLSPRRTNSNQNVSLFQQFLHSLSPNYIVSGGISLAELIRQEEEVPRQYRQHRQQQQQEEEEEGEEEDNAGLIRQSFETMMETLRNLMNQNGQQP